MLITMKKNGEKIEKTYKQVLSKDYGKLKNYHALRMKDAIDILCDCQEDAIWMTLSYFKSTDNYHIRSMPKQSHLHHKKCPFHQDYEGSGEHEKGWEEKEDEHGNPYFSVNLDKLAFGGTKKEKAKRKEADKVTPPVSLWNRPSQRKTGPSKTDVTLLGMATRLNMMAFEDYQNSSKHFEQLPKSRRDLIQQAWATSRKIDIKNRRVLRDYWYEERKAYHSKHKEQFFVFHPAVRIEHNYYRDSNIYIEFFEGGKSKEVRIKNELLEEAMKKNIFTKNKYVEDLTSSMLKNFIVSGFVEIRRMKSGSYVPHFLSFELIPVTKFGLWIESGYEEVIYSLLHKENILFTKPYETFEFYGNYIPDILFREPKHPGRIYIGEIFGVKGSSAYDERKNDKLALSGESDQFDLWHWAPEGQPPFKVDPFY